MVYRTIETDSAVYLERLIHKLLDAQRAPNGEFFHVTSDELDSAVAKAGSLMSEFVPVHEEARKLQRRKPTGPMVEPSAELALLYRELRDSEQEMFFLEQRISLLQNRLKVAIGDNAGIFGLASWKWRDQEVFDQSRLKAEEPNIFEKYRRTRGSRVFQLLRGNSIPSEE